MVGRPNVGKSTLFNRLVGKRLALVDNQPGVTRDRLSHLISHGDRFFEVVDTGGMGIEDVDNLTNHIEQQIDAALASADVILFVVDTRDGILPLDEEVARRLRYVDKPILCVANKTDDESFDAQADNFFRLGRGKLVKVSTLQNRGRDELMEQIHQRLPEEDEGESAQTPEMRVAIVGRRNVGKSTFVNTLAHAERMIVSEVPGTTRDSVDVRFELDGKSFIAIDTPGLTRSGSVKTDIDFYSTHRAKRTIRYADIVLMFFAANERIGKVDKQLVSYIGEHYKPCVFVVNKWDIMHNQMPTEKWVRYLRDNFSTMWHVPIAFVTGQTGKNVKALINHTQMLYKQSLERVSTGELNRLIERAVEKNPPPLFRGRRPKLYYATQVASQPPTIVMFVNDPKAFTHTYKRYLLGVLRDQLRFGEVPIKLYLQARGQGAAKDGPTDSQGQARTGA
ncbi:MAG: ribosome biogenesis GTPase Der [Planctomycetales bacterium]|nr:ribosome biogenesis GTPase Der [Planctomycetales bacterium]